MEQIEESNYNAISLPGKKKKKGGERERERESKIEEAMIVDQ